MIISFLWSLSYVLATFGFTAVCFTTGALGNWTPSTLTNAMWQSGERPGNERFYFPGIVGVTGLAGTALGSYWAARWRRTNPGADALVLGIGSLLAGPLTYASLLSLESSINAFWPFLFFTMLALCLNFAVIVDIVTGVVPSHYRSTALAFQTLIAHLLGNGMAIW